MIGCVALSILLFCFVIYATVSTGADNPWVCSCKTRLNIVDETLADGSHVYYGHCPKCGYVTPRFRSLNELKMYEEGV